MRTLGDARDGSDGRRHHVMWLESERAEALRRADALDSIFTFVRERGRWVYGVRGIAGWKRKFRAQQSVTFCAVADERPLRAVLASAAALLL